MRVLACLACLAVVGVLAAPAAAQPEKRKCPVCAVVVVIGADEVIGAGIAAGLGAGAVGYAIHRLNDSTSKAQSIARSPGGHSAFLRRMRENRGDGKRIWAHVGNLKGLWRYVRNRTSLKHIKKRLPDAAWACGVSGVVSFLLNGNAKDARNACIGAGVGTVLK